MEESPPQKPLNQYEEALAGIGAGIVSTCCMHPLDLLKVQYQVATASPAAMLTRLRDIARADGYSGLYRGLSPNMFGNASSWGLYFLWYTLFKKRMAGGDPDIRLNPGQHLLASASSGVVTAFMTNPLWVVKTRMFTSTRSTRGAYRGVFDGLWRIAREEGMPGLYRGTTLALIGVSNGVIQFVTYEHLKRWARDRKRRRRGEKLGGEYDSIPLSNSEYIVMSGAAKLLAIGVTYPYQVVRSRLQNQSANPLSPGAIARLPPSSRPYASIPDCVSRTWRSEGFTAFYRGLWPSAVRVLPGTCVTFVVYENLAAHLRQRGRMSDR